MKKTHPFDISQYTGEKITQHITSKERRLACQANYDQLKANYTGGVEFQLREKMILLCDQTADYLYQSPCADSNDPQTARLNYKPGSRPELEKVVNEVTAGLDKDQEKALALMRFCRDLYKTVPPQKLTDSTYIFGGTEEQLIEKGEELCECLGRLFTALCEIAGIYARIIMHTIGGHITAEAYVDGQWGYIDPRTAAYFLKKDGKIASLWELMNNNEIVWQQSDAVKADVSDRWTWNERAWRCVNLYFAPEEINGFMYYSLGDTDQYDYHQTTQEMGTKAGMWEINKVYCELIEKVFNMSTDYQKNWNGKEMKKVPITYRHDGFTTYFHYDAPMTAEQIKEIYIDPFKGSNVNAIAWGLGPGSVFCFDTKVGEIIGDGLTEKQWDTMFRDGDKRVNKTIHSLNDSGKGPLKIAAERGRELGIKIYGRLEMNHEYGPAKDDCWNYVGFTGSFNKNHPEYRIKEQHPDLLNLSYEYEEVRNFKLAILSEAIEKGVDGLTLDFLVSPPHFDEPKPEIMTEFIRKIRAMLDEAGKARDQKLDLAVRIPADMCEENGIDWKTWMKEGIVDIVLPGPYYVKNYLDYNIEEFTEMGNRTGCKVYGTLWFALGLVCTDPFADEKNKGKKYDKEKTKEMYYAQALLLHRAGVDGIQFEMTSNEWHERRFIDDLADPKLVEFADKHYMVNIESNLPVKFTESKNSKIVPLRIADDIAKAKENGYEVEAKILLYCDRVLDDGEKIEISMNDQKQAAATSDSLSFAKDKEAVDLESYKHTTGFTKAEDFLFDKEWWRAGEHTVSINPEDILLGENKISLSYQSEQEKSLTIRWIDFLIKYNKK